MEKKGNLHHCLLCLGSNHQARICLDKAERMLNEHFPSIRWGEIVKTLPENTSCQTPYLNRAALIDTEWDATSMHALFKEIEKSCGRTAESKQTGIMPLDIDLLVVDGEVFKPADLEKEYVRLALHALPTHLD